MAKFENLEAAVEKIESGLTLKSDYSEEIEHLNGLYGDIAVFRHCGTPVWKCTDLRKRITHLINWMKDEMIHSAS